MNAGSSVDDVRTTLLQWANELAEQSRALGREQRDSILRQNEERLRQREEREKRQAQSMAERTRRQKVEASRLKAKAELDRLRWELVQEILDRTRARLESLAADEARYLPILKGLLGRAAEAMGSDALMAEVNQQDRDRLEAQWETIVQETVPQRSIQLAQAPIACIGGVRLRDPEDRIGIDNTFEGRLERLHDEVVQIIIECLFEDTVSLDDLMHG